MVVLLSWIWLIKDIFGLWDVFKILNYFHILFLNWSFRPWIYDNHGTYTLSFHFFSSLLRPVNIFRIIRSLFSIDFVLYKVAKASIKAITNDWQNPTTFIRGNNLFIFFHAPAQASLNLGYSYSAKFSLKQLCYLPFVILKQCVFTPKKIASYYEFHYPYLLLLNFFYHGLRI